MSYSAPYQGKTAAKVQRSEHNTNKCIQKNGELRSQPFLFYLKTKGLMGKNAHICQP